CHRRRARGHPSRGTSGGQGAEEVVIRGHAARAWCVAYHPSGRYLASGDEDGVVKVWDLTHDPEHTAIVLGGLGHRQAQALAFAPDGRDLQVVLKDGKFAALDADTGLERRGHLVDMDTRWLTPATVAAFSGDARGLATVSRESPGRVRLHDAATGKPDG